MGKPTLQEVKERFKNAKEVKCNEYKSYGKIHEIDFETIRYIHEKSTQVICNSVKNDTAYVSLFNEGQYAEIISYKEPLYQLTAKELRYGAENPQWLKDTFKECFETEFLNKWATSLNEYEGKTMVFVTNENDLSNIGYGINYRGEWRNSYDISGDSFLSMRLATEKEVEEALKNQSIKNGNIFCNWKFENNILYGTNCCLNVSGVKWTKLFDNGYWLDLTPTYTIPEAESKFNIKIVEKNV